MLDKCSELAKLLSLEFNVEKSHCFAVGSMSNVTMTQLSLCGISVEWCRVAKYLGVYLQSGRSLKFDISATKRARAPRSITMINAHSLQAPSKNS